MKPLGNALLPWNDRRNPKGEQVAVLIRDMKALIAEANAFIDEMCGD